MFAIRFLVVCLMYVGFANVYAGYLTHRNSTVYIDPYSEFGLSLWSVDGINQVFN